jgi:hypothetical protein
MLIAWASIAIATLALFLTVFEAREQRKANRLSVMPYLSIYYDLSPELSEVGLFVQNVGLGPAIVLERSIHLGDRVYRREQGARFGEFSGLNEPWKLGDILPGSSVAPGDRVMILGFDQKDMTPERKRLLLELVIPKVSYEVEYGSFYGESWKISSSMSTSISGERRMNLKRVP